MYKSTNINGQHIYIISSEDGGGEIAKDNTALVFSPSQWEWVMSCLQVPAVSQAEVLLKRMMCDAALDVEHTMFTGTVDELSADDIAYLVSLMEDD